MELFDAIYGRRAVHAFTDDDVASSVLDSLIDAAIQAPSALNSQPWQFLVIRGRGVLADHSERAKAHYLATFSPGRDPHAIRHDMLNQPGFNLFYNAPAVIVIYAAPAGQFSSGDCCFAAQNLMLAAFAKGFGTCPVGFAQSWFDLTEIKMRLNVPSHLTAVLPIAIGVPLATPQKTTRNPPVLIR